jgi:hypothetical protein
MPSGASTPIAIKLPSRSVASCSLTMGGPSKTFLILYPRVSGTSPALCRTARRRASVVVVPGVLTGADRAPRICGTAEAPSNGQPLSFGGR